MMGTTLVNITLLFAIAVIVLQSFALAEKHHHGISKSFGSKVFFEPHHGSHLRNPEAHKDIASKLGFSYKRSRGIGKDFRVEDNKGFFGGITKFINGIFAPILKLITNGLNTILGTINIQLISVDGDQNCTCDGPNGSKVTDKPGDGISFNPVKIILNLVKTLIGPVLDIVINFANSILENMGITLPTFSANFSVDGIAGQDIEIDTSNPFSFIFSVLGSIFGPIINIGISIINLVFGNLFGFHLLPFGEHNTPTPPPESGMSTPTDDDMTTKAPGGNNNLLSFFLNIVLKIFTPIINTVISVINFLVGGIFGFKIPSIADEVGSSVDPIAIIVNVFSSIFSSIINIVTNLINGVLGFLNFPKINFGGSGSVGVNGTVSGDGWNPIKVVIGIFNNLLAPILNPIIGLFNFILGLFGIGGKGGIVISTGGGGLLGGGIHIGGSVGGGGDVGNDTKASDTEAPKYSNHNKNN